MGDLFLDLEGKVAGGGGGGVQCFLAYFCPPASSQVTSYPKSQYVMEAYLRVGCSGPQQDQ